MGISEQRFFAVDHVIYMLLAVLFAHLGSILPKRARDGFTRHKRAALWFTLTLIIILLGTPWWRPLFPAL